MPEGHGARPCTGPGASLGTDPNDADSDGDGFSDAAEVAAGSNPLDPGSLPGGPEVPALPGAAPLVLGALLLATLSLARRRAC